MYHQNLNYGFVQIRQVPKSPKGHALYLITTFSSLRGYFLNLIVHSSPKPQTLTMKLTILALMLPMVCNSFSFAPPRQHPRLLSRLHASETSLKSERFADELGIPCEDECSMDCFPNMPER